MAMLRPLEQFQAWGDSPIPGIYLIFDLVMNLKGRERGVWVVVDRPTPTTWFRFFLFRLAVPPLLVQAHDLLRNRQIRREEPPTGAYAIQIVPTLAGLHENGIRQPSSEQSRLGHGYPSLKDVVSSARGF